MNPLRIAVVGVGHLGKHHARILSTLPDVMLTAVVDVNRERAREVAAASSTEPLFDVHGLTGRVCAIAVSATHMVVNERWVVPVFATAMARGNDGSVTFAIRKINWGAA